MRPAWRPHRLPDACAAAAMALAGASVVALLVLHTLRPEVDPLRQAASAYAHGEHSWLLAAVVITQTASLLAVGTAIATRGAAVGGRWASVAILVVAAGGTALAGMHVPSTGSPAAIGALVTTCAVPLAAVALVAWRTAAGDHVGRRGLIAVCALVVLSAGVLLLLAGPDEPIGAFQRGFFGATALWVLAAGSHVRGSDAPETATEQDRQLAVA